MPGSIVDGSAENSAASGRKRRFRPTLWPTLATLVVFPVLLGLGWWQLERADFKQALEARVEAEGARAPVLLGAGLREQAVPPEAWNHRRVRALGHYLPRHFLLDNRTRRGVAGFHVLTPFAFDEAQRLGVMVNRGWIPLGSDRSHLPAITTPAETLEVRGRSRVPGKAFLLGEAGYRGEIWPRVVQSVELDEMEEALGIDLLPFVVELNSADSHGFERAWQTYGGLSPERHRGYAFQWFALAATLLVIYVAVNFRRQ